MAGIAGSTRVVTVSAAIAADCFLPACSLLHEVPPEARAHMSALQESLHALRSGAHSARRLSCKERIMEKGGVCHV